MLTMQDGTGEECRCGSQMVMIAAPESELHRDGHHQVTNHANSTVEKCGYGSGVVTAVAPGCELYQGGHYAH